MSIFNLFNFSSNDCNKALSANTYLNFNIYSEVSRYCSTTFSSAFSYNFNRIYQESCNQNYTTSNYNSLFDSCFSTSLRSNCTANEAEKIISDFSLSITSIIQRHWGDRDKTIQCIKDVSPNETTCNLITNYYSRIVNSGRYSCTQSSIALGVFSKSCFGSLIICGSVDLEYYKKNCHKEKIWCDGELDHLIDSLKDKFDRAKCEKSPLVIDLNGDGIKTTSLSSSNVHFDMNNNGFAEKTGWISTSDGFLVIDKNHNGTIDNGSELFGNYSDSTSENGFEALSNYDTNHDGKINIFDSSYYSIKVWQDKNSNGITDDGELYSLASLGIKSINTNYTETNIDSNGNTIKQTSTITKFGGQSLDIADVWFDTDDIRTINTSINVTDTSILALPEIDGFGTVSSLQQAMQVDTTGQLKSLVESFKNAQSLQEKYALINDIVFSWAGTFNLDPNSLIANNGQNYIGDARIVYTLEKFLDDDYKGYACDSDIQDSDNPNTKSAKTLKIAYGELLNYTFGKLLSQTSSSSLIDAINVTWDTCENTCKVDTSKLIEKINSLYCQNKEKTIQSVYELGSALSSLGSTGDKALAQLKNWASSITDTDLSFSVQNMTLNPIYGSNTSETINSNNLINTLVYGLDGNDTINGSLGNDMIFGGAGNDRINDVFGDDYLNGGAGNDTYIFTTKSGHDVIEDNAGTDQILLTDKNPSRIWFEHKNNDLVVSIIGMDTSMTIKNWYTSSENHIESFKALDGSVLLDSQVQNLVDAMASLTPPAVGQTVLSADYQNQLSAVIAANWH